MKTLIFNIPLKTRIRFWFGLSSCLLFVVACRKDDEAAMPVMSIQAVPLKDTLRGIIGENTLLTNNRTWYLDGWVYVSNEASLHIEPGTIMKVLHHKESMQGGIVVTRGAKIHSSGTKYVPVILTGDDTTTDYRTVAMGIIILGRAPVKQPLSIIPIPDAAMSGSLAYGGQLPDDSSGVLQYTEIIYPAINGGKVTNTNKATGLFLFGTGSRTVVGNVRTRQKGSDRSIIKNGLLK